MTHQYSESTQGGPGIFLGGLLVLWGLLAFGSRAGWLPPIEYWKFWPLILVWIGLVKLTSSLGRGERRLTGITFVAIGAFLQAFYLGLVPMSWEVIWPGLLIFIGLRLMINSLLRRGRGTRKAAPPNVKDGALVADINFGGAKDTFEGRTFAGGDIRCSCAGYELDLRGAHIEQSEAILNLDISMGGVEIRVPRSWRVEVDVTPVMAAIENQTNYVESPDSRRLIVRGRIFMSGVEIKN